MIYTYPNYYERFTCVADKCEDTCCAGWQILIDDESLDRYKKEHKNDKRIDWENEVFCHKEGKRCAFLNERNLCDMYIEWGEKSLCVTCDRYPRHIEEFENVREFTLSLSCPEVAKLVLFMKDKVNFIEKEDDIEEIDEEFDALMYSMLLDIRSVFYELLQDRDLSIEIRITNMLKIAEKCQQLIDDGDIFGINDYIDEFGLDKSMFADYYEGTFQRFKRLYELEVLNDLWENMTDEAAELIYGEGADKCNKMHKDFEGWLNNKFPDNSIMWEQILIYFVSTYLCGAVYDGNLIGKVETAITSLVCIYEMLLARWIKNDKELSFEDIVFITYMYSRELEHSDINLDTMEDV